MLDAKLWLCVPVAGILLSLQPLRVGAGQVVDGLDSEGADRTALNELVDLARLVDLCAKRLNLRIEYDAKILQGQMTTLRLAEPVDDEALWILTNQLLAAKGFTCISPPGDDVLSIVALSEAQARARLEPTWPSDTKAGFVKVRRMLKHRPAKEVVETIKPLLSKASGEATALDAINSLILADLTPRVDQLMDLIDRMDAPDSQVNCSLITPANLTATQLATQVMATVIVRNTLVRQPLTGKLAPLAESQTVLLIAPPEEVPVWNELIDLIDRGQALLTRTYVAEQLPLTDVARLIEQTGRAPGSRGSADRWRLVADTLTDSLIITATPAEHETIAGLVQRLNNLSPEARRPVRTFAVRNRQVKEIVQILNDLIEAGVVDVQSTPPGGTGSDSSARRNPESDQAPQTSTVEAVPTPFPGEGQQTSVRAPMRDRQRTAQADGDSKTAAGTRSATLRTVRSLTLTADEATNTIIAMGESRLLAQIEQLIRQLDVRQAQVLLEVMVISLSEGQTLDLGVELQKLEISGSTLISLSSMFGLVGPIAGGSALPAATGSGGTGVVLSPGDFSVVIRALETVNEGRSLSMPRVLVSNNQQAKLDSVLQQPFASTNASTTVATTSFGGTQDAGTTVTIKPQIAEGDHLLLEYSVALSSFVGESSDPSLPPPRQQNSLSSIVSIPDGYTVVLGGLELITEADAVSQVPLLGSLPLIGEAFKNRSQSGSRSRFYIFIRANVLRNRNFEDLKYLSDEQVTGVGGLPEAGAWPEVKPQIIR